MCCVICLETCWIVKWYGRFFFSFHRRKSNMLFYPFFQDIYLEILQNLFSSFLIIDCNIVIATDERPHRWKHLFIIGLRLNHCSSVYFYFILFCFFHSVDFQNPKWLSTRYWPFFHTVNRFTKLSRCQNENQLKSTALLSLDSVFRMVHFV